MQKEARMFYKLLTNKFISVINSIEYGSVELTTPDNIKHTFKGKNAGPHATLVLHDWRVIPRLVTKGDIGFAEDYMQGLWETNDLTALILISLLNEEKFDSFIYGGFWGRVWAQVSYFFRTNTLRGSKRNIQAHYDLGNDFYQLWLDPTMTYSSALFKSENETLQQAQQNKYSRIIERLGAKAGDLLEIGCGWGGFIKHALSLGNFKMKGITLSKEQKAYAEKILQANVEIALEDYRAQQGKYDYIVSIEMFEAVGEKYWPAYFGKIKSLLKDNGKAIIQAITIKDPLFEVYRRSGDMIRTFIFPGGMLISPQRFALEAKKAGLAITDQFSFGQDYARTLKLWLEKFEAQRQMVYQLGFDEAFIRLWRFYLSACCASFMSGRTDVVQVELQHS